ncbi:MAG: exonuclease RecJ [Haloarculaceae archaeon]
MSTADRPDADLAPGAVAARLRDAGLVRLLAAADGDALAAAGLLGQALADADVPYQASVCRFPNAGATDADVTVGLGHDDGDVALAGPEPTSAGAYAVAVELDADPDPVLALAGQIAANAVPGETAAGALETATERGLVERRPGVAVPTADLADGLAHSTFVHAAFSGDVGAVRDELAALGLSGTPDESDRRRLASLVALAAVEDAPARAATAVERVLRPYVADAYSTVGGHADVLEAVARSRPGTGLALVLGHGGRTSALDAWRDHARAAHDALRTADLARHRGLTVAAVPDAPDATVETIARLCRDYRSTEPVAVAVAGPAVAVATTDRDAGALVRETTRAVGGASTGRARLAYAEPDDCAAFVDELREALA